jgi:hypothetical protein
MSKQEVYKVYESIRELEYINEKVRSILVEMLIVDDILDIRSDLDDQLLYEVLSGEYWKPYIQLSDEDILLEIKSRNFLTDAEEFESWLEEYYNYELKGMLNKPSLKTILQLLELNKEEKQSHNSIKK